jgi:anaerobic magnesium-protoporphyrin IX monomethyl ester cyclase
LKVILVNTDFMHDTDTKVQPLTMYTIAGIITPYVDEVEVVEPMKYRLGYEESDLLSVVLGKIKSADLLAFTVNSFSWAEISKLTKKIKVHNSNIKIVVGGIHISYFYKDILLNNPQIDYALVGEAELAFPKFIKYLKGEISVHDVPNLKYVHNGQLMQNKNAPLFNLNSEVPLPRYDLTESKFFDRFTFEASRGCLGNCRFCSVYYKRCWRRFSEDIVLERLSVFKKYLDGRCKSKDFIFTDDCFTTDSRWARNVLEGMLDLGYRDYNALIEARAKHLWDEALLETIKSFDNLHIQIGIESGYDEGLKKVNKEIKVEDILKTVSLLEKYDLCKNVFTSFIIGFPWESKEECLKTIEFAAFLNDQYSITVNVAWWMPLPSYLFSRYFKDTSIFAQEDFATNENVFYRAHPKIDNEDTAFIEICDSLYKNLGVCWRL